MNRPENEVPGHVFLSVHPGFHTINQREVISHEIIGPIPFHDRTIYSDS